MRKNTIVVDSFVTINAEATRDGLEVDFGSLPEEIMDYILTELRDGYYSGTVDAYSWAFEVAVSFSNCEDIASNLDDLPEAFVEQIAEGLKEYDLRGKETYYEQFGAELSEYSESFQDYYNSHKEDRKVATIATSTEPLTLYRGEVYELGDIIGETLDLFETDAEAIKDAQESGAVAVLIYDEESEEFEQSSLNVIGLENRPWTLKTLVQVF